MSDYRVRGAAGGGRLHADGGDRAGAGLGLGPGHRPPRHQEEGGPGEPRRAGRQLQAVQVTAAPSSILAAIFSIESVKSGDKDSSVREQAP